MDDLIVIVGCENICRLCLQTTDTMSDIFATNGEKSLQKQILCITGLDAEEGDGLPSKICHQCLHIVEQACELRDVVNVTQKILARKVPGNQTKCSYDNDFDNFLHNSPNNKDPDSDVDTVYLENYYEDDPQDASVEGTMLEEDDGFPQAMDTSEVRESRNNVSYVNDNTETPATIPRRKNDGKRRPARLICQLCLVQFDSEEEVRMHAMIHYVGSDLKLYLDINSSPYVCTFCDEIQLNKVQLVKHHRRHLGINPYICQHPGCTYQGKDRDGLRHHRVVHSAPSRECEVCGAMFRRRAELVTHTRYVHPAAAAARLAARTCVACGLRLRDERARWLHMKAHHFTLRFPCPYGSCERAYRSRRALADHERAHRGLRRYRCPLCSRADFTCVKTLKRHMEEHDRSSLLKCGQCPATFEEEAALCRHRTAHHGPACHTEYAGESQLRKNTETCEPLQSLKYEGHKNGQTDTSMRSIDEDGQTVLEY